ncbi:FKBP-type peptidyl-prolyl cis-trans isomerase [Candidatus Micrarchaeota archaeon]|nr:FKBP-type peptidyl-prolyl cis-trans isomerase [Candidatus Micrarchaeota archaeon]
MSDFVRLSYEAKADGKAAFKSEDVPIILGEGLLFPKLEESIMEMRDGEEKLVHLEPEDAFGNRSASLVKLVPITVFRANGLNPIHGLVVSVEGITGKIQSVSGGRVRVDFNHELAGKPLDIKLRLVRRISDTDEKVGVVFEYNFHTKPAEIRHEDGKLVIKPSKGVLDSADYQARKVNFLHALKKLLDAEARLEE